jgi:hypothetical protein
MNMTLTQQQKNFFDTFGFLHLKGAMSKDVGWITEAFEVVHRNGRNNHDGTKRSTIVPFIDQNEKLCTLLEHPVVEGAAESLLGPNFNYLAGDGNYYVGDTSWHSDGWWDTTSVFLKIAFYLDPLTRDSGALRVIPGSVPAAALETEPGDLAIFNHNTKHASFGGSKHRRMFTLNLGQHAKTPAQFDCLKKYLSCHIPSWAPRTHSELMRSTANERRMRHLSQVIENEAHVAELYQKSHPQPVNA